jgi:hypothetical protein
VTNKDGQTVGALEVGMAFESEKDAYEMYNAYVEHDEFSIRKSNTKCRADKTIYSKLVVCSSQEFGETISSQASTRMGCNASMSKFHLCMISSLLCLNSAFAYPENMISSLLSKFCLCIS